VGLNLSLATNDINTKIDSQNTNEETTQETQEIVTFIDDYPENRLVIPRSTLATDIQDEDFMPDLTGFLARPVLLKQQTFTTFSPIVKFPLHPLSNSANFIFSADFPYDALKVGGRIDKLNNFTFMTGDLIVKVQFNTQPFNAGKVYCFIAPFDFYVSDQLKAGSYGTPGITAFPGVYVDLQQNTSAEIRIPFISLYEAWYLYGPTKDLKTVSFYIAPITTLQGVDPSTTLSVYTWFENAKLYGPTNKTLQIQMNNPNDVTHFVNTPASGFTQCQNSDSAVSLAATQNVTLSSTENIFHTNDPEMDLEYVASNPAVVSTIPWKTTDVIKKVIGSYNVSLYPEDSQKYTVSGTVYTAVAPAPCEYVASSFKYWCGTLVYKISVVKTAFHTGRLAFTFIPKSAVISGNIDISNTYTQILDLTNSNFIEIDIPFISDRIMLNTQPFVSDPDVGTLDFSNCSTGSFSISVLNALTCPATVKPEVDVIVEKYVRNVCFSSPVGSSMYPSTLPSPTPPQNQQRRRRMILLKKTKSPKPVNIIHLLKKLML